MLTRLRRAPHKPAPPSIYLTIARSLGNKVDELELIITAQKSVLDCSLIVITETWLHGGIPDEAIMLTGHTAHRADRNRDSSKSRGGGLCIYPHSQWGTNATITDARCSPDLEYITVRCRPFLGVYCYYCYGCIHPTLHQYQGSPGYSAVCH